MKLGPTVAVTTRTWGDPVGAWAHADPENGAYLIVCGMMQVPARNLSAGYVTSSADGGASWKRSLFDDTTKFVSEEQCAYGQRGTAYFIAGASNYYHGLPHHETGHMHLYASGDRGTTWTRRWTRRDGWIDWTAIAVSSPIGHPDGVVVFGNAGTDRLGHWSPPRPVAVESQDGGRTFSGLVAPHPAGFKYVAVWTGDSVVLPNGVALFSTSTARAPRKANVMEWWGGDVAVEIFAYDPSRHAIQSRAVLRTRRKVPIFLASMAQDRSGGRFNHRLYAAWVEFNATSSALWLGSSDDNGYHWVSRPIRRGSGSDFLAGCETDRPIDQVKIAVAPDGTLGVAWTENLSHVVLVSSRDGGSTFGSPTTVADVDTSPLKQAEATTWNDYWMKAVLDIEFGRPDQQGKWLNVLGLGVLLDPSVLLDLSLVGDRNGDFHVFWIAPNGDGDVLMTRTATVAEIGKSTPELTSESERGGCATKRASRLAHPALPGPLPQVTFAGGRDVTSSVALDPVSFHYDSRSHTMNVDARIINKGKRTLSGPLTIVGINPHSDFGNARVRNSTGSIAGQPYWDASSLIPSSGLAPGAKSKPLHVEVAIASFRPALSNYLSGDGFSLAIRAYEGRP